MVSLFRLKGRALQIGNLFLLSLTLATAVLLFFTVNLLPVIYIKGIEPYFSSVAGGLRPVLNLVLSFFILMLTFSAFCSMNLGIKRFYLKRAGKHSATALDIFYYLRPKKLPGAFVFSLRINFIRLIFFAFCNLPTAACLFLLYNFSASGASVSVCIAVTVTALCFFVSGSIFYRQMALSLFLCEYYYIEGSFVSFRHLISSSQKAMKDKKMFLERIRLSFSGWFLLCLLILPIGYVWSYYNQTLAVAAVDFMKGKTK